MLKVSFDSTPQEVTNEDINSLVLERSDHKGTGSNIPKAKDSHKDMKYTEEEEGENSGVNPITNSLINVSANSWQKNIHRPRDGNPEFYSDYSRPRTRPPSHN